jgi:hypothetical protein
MVARMKTRVKVGIVIGTICIIIGAGALVFTWIVGRFSGITILGILMSIFGASFVASIVANLVVYSTTVKKGILHL